MIFLKTFKQRCGLLALCGFTRVLVYLLVCVSMSVCMCVIGEQSYREIGTEGDGKEAFNEKMANK